MWNSLHCLDIGFGVFLKLWKLFSHYLSLYNYVSLSPFILDFWWLCENRTFSSWCTVNGLSMCYDNDLLCWLQVASFIYLSVLCCTDAVFMFIMTWKFRITKHCFRAPPLITVCSNNTKLTSLTRVLPLVTWKESLAMIFTFRFFKGLWKFF